MEHDATLFVNLPPDILLQVFGECDVFDVLNLSSTCKRLRQATEEHQTWLCQAKRLQIPIPNGPNPSKAELKDLVISRARVDTCWIKRRSGYLRPRELTANAPLISSHYLPGGNFVVLLYESGSIDLREVQGEDAGGWNLVRVARYEQRDVHDRPAPLSELLTKTSYGSPVLAYTNEAGNKLFVFLIDHISQTIEKEQVVDISNHGSLEVWEILATQNKIICCRQEQEGWGILVVQLSGPNTIQKHFILQSLAAIEDYDFSMVRFFSVPGNGIVVTHLDGIRLYHIPELESVDDGSVLFPVWSWSGESTRYEGSVYDIGSRFPILHIQGSSNIHKLEFGLGSGFPVVLRHTITAGQSVHCEPDEDEWQKLFLKGRKGVCLHQVFNPPAMVFYTSLVGREDITGVFRICTNELFDILGVLDLWSMDLDEGTGRLLLGVDLPGRYPYQQRLWLVDPLV